MPWIRIASAIVAIFSCLSCHYSRWLVLCPSQFVLRYSWRSWNIFSSFERKECCQRPKTTLVLSQLLLLTAIAFPHLTDAVFPLTGALICFYLLFQPKFASIADISSSMLGLFYGGYLPMLLDSATSRVGARPHGVKHCQHQLTAVGLLARFLDATEIIPVSVICNLFGVWLYLGLPILVLISWA